MTEQTQPTDAEIDLLISKHWPAFATVGAFPLKALRNAFREGIFEWGTPAGAGAPVAPDFYTACAWYEGGGEAGWIPLPGYSNETEHGVKHLVLEAARKEGYKGTAAGRLFELGWEIRPVYLAPQPTQAQAGAVPLTDEWIRSMCKEPWIFESAKQWVRITEAAHGIKGGQHGTD